MKADHNPKWKSNFLPLVVLDLSYRIKWKQITTEPKVRPWRHRCLGSKLPNKMKADHNCFPRTPFKYSVVLDLSYRIKWKQITTPTQWPPQYRRCLGSKLPNKMKADHNVVRCKDFMTGCLGSKLPNKMKADHNCVSIWPAYFEVVLDLSYRIKWKQITTAGAGGNRVQRLSWI